jgi:hypothetical protein
MVLMAEVACLSIKAQTNEWQIDWNFNAESAWEWFDIQGKLDLNTASLTDFLQFEFTEEEASCMVKHRITYGPWLHETELQRCSLSIERIQECRKFILPLVRRSPDAIFSKSFWRNPRMSQAVSALYDPKKDGQLTHHYQTHLHWGTSSRLSFLTQTDAGEQFFDYYTANWEIKNRKYLKHAVIGRYQWNWNQGLTHNAPYAVGRSFDIGSWVNNQQELRSSVSQNEDLGLWGIAAHLNFPRWNLFVSSGKRTFDARLNPSENAFTQRQYGGIHRTPLEISRKSNNELHQRFFGLQTHFYRQEVTVSFTNYHYQIPRFTPQKLLFEEKIIEIQHVMNNVFSIRSLFNFSSSNSGVHAWYGAAVKSLHPKIDIAFRHSHIPQDYFGPERSPYSMSDVGKDIREWGIDLFPQSKNLLQIRSIQENRIVARNIQVPELPKSIFQVQYMYQNKQKEILQLRIRQQVNHYNQPFQLDLAYKVALVESWNLKLAYQWKQAPIGLVNNTATMAQVSYHLKDFSAHLYGLHFLFHETGYLLLPSAQYPWRLGIFTGQGNALGIVGKWKLTPHIHCRFSVEWINYEKSQEKSNQNPRIFVQLEYL